MWKCCVDPSNVKIDDPLLPPSTMPALQRTQWNVSGGKLNAPMSMAYGYVPAIVPRDAFSTSPFG